MQDSDPYTLPTELFWPPEFSRNLPLTDCCSLFFPATAAEAELLRDPSSGGADASSRCRGGGDPGGGGDRRADEDAGSQADGGTALPLAAQSLAAVLPCGAV